MRDGEQGREGGAAEGEGGGERDAGLVDALERERMAVAATAWLQEERTTLNERITPLTNETLQLETRLEHTTSQMELAGVGEETPTLTGGGVILGTVGARQGDRVGRAQVKEEGRLTPVTILEI